MGQPSAEWIAEQREAEAALIVRGDELYDAILCTDRQITSLEARAAALSIMPNGDPDAVERQARALRLVVSVAAFHLANLDRVHLLEEPSRRKRAGTGR